MHKHDRLWWTLRQSETLSQHTRQKKMPNIIDILYYKYKIHNLKWFILTLLMCMLVFGYVNVNAGFNRGQRPHDPWSWSYRQLEATLCQCWKPNSGPLQEHCMNHLLMHSRARARTHTLFIWTKTDTDKSWQSGSHEHRGDHILSHSGNLWTFGLGTPCLGAPVWHLPVHRTACTKEVIVRWWRSESSNTFSLTQSPSKCRQAQ